MVKLAEQIAIEAAMVAALEEACDIMEAMARHAEYKHHGHGLEINDNIRWETGLTYWVVEPEITVTCVRNGKIIEHDDDLLNQEQADRLMQVLQRNAAEQNLRRLEELCRVEKERREKAKRK